MSTLIKLINGAPSWANDPFVDLADEDAAPAGSGIIVSLTRLQAEADALLTGARPVGVRLNPDEPVEALEPYLDRLSLVALVFPKFRDGRAFSSASLLRQRYGFKGEIRAVGEVLRELARFMVRCGMDAYMPSDGSTPDDWARAVGRFRHVYQTAADGQTPAFAERAGV
ncbi:MAG: oxidoreductase [Caulobacterales bacterium 32-69-10]|nr:MAG: oxidoreductase [Caulobacterales bacterium 32-69-10]